MVRLSYIVKLFPITVGFFIGWFGFEAGLTAFNLYRIFSQEFALKCFLGVVGMIVCAYVDVWRLRRKEEYQW